MATSWKDEDLQKVYCTAGTTVRLWSSEEERRGGSLDRPQSDETFQAKLAKVVSVMCPRRRDGAGPGVTSRRYSNPADNGQKNNKGFTLM